MAQSFRTAISFDGLASASSQALAIKVDGDSQNRVLVDAGGKITWGAGGSSAGDTTLYRSAANTLKTDDAFTAASLAVTGEFTLPTSDGSNNQVLVTNGSGTVSWANQSGGGGGSPGGSDGQVQYNNGGAFGGASGLHFDDGNARLGIGTTSPSTKLEVADSNPATLTLKGTNSIVTAGTEVQAIDFYQSDASGGAGVSARIVGVGNNSSGAQNLTFHTGQAGATSVAERVRIDSNGNVGIGTDSPERALHVNSGTVNTSALFESTDANVRIYMQDSGSTDAEQVGLLGVSDDLRLVAGGGARLTINSDGDVGIGTTSPDTNLHIQTDHNTLVHIESTDAESLIAFSDSNSTGNWYDRRLGVYGEDMTFITNNTRRMTILDNGNVGIGDDTPSYKLDVNGTGRFTSTLTVDGNIDGQQDFTVGNGEGELVLFQGSSNQVFVQSNGTYRAYWNSSGHYLPYADSSYDLGGSSIRWRTAYTDTLTTATANATTINLNTSIHLTNVDADGSMRVQGNTGYIDIGPKNSTYCHIYTDRGSFYFNKTNLYANSTSKKIWHRGDFRGGSANVAVNSSGYGTISHGLGATPDYAFVTSYTTLSSDNDNQLAFPVTGVNSSTITFRAYEINGNGNSNYTSSTIYSATVYVYWMAANF